MEKISRRNFLGLAVKAGLVGLVGSAIPEFAEACVDKQEKRTSLDVITPILRNPEIIKRDKDGKIYARFNVSLEVINNISLHPEKYDFTSTEGNDKEPFYQTLEEAIENRQTDTTYIVEFDVKNQFNPGSISGVYTKSGKPLESFSAYRCIGSPLKFEE